MSTNYIDQITDTAGTTHDISEGDSTRIFRATCSTAAGTTAKVATLQTSSRNFSLATGVRVAVTFTYGNSATTPTLNVNSSGAKTIAVATSATTKATGNGTTYNTWGPYETVIFTYDGTYWVNEGSSLSIYNSYNYNNLSNKPTIPTLPSNIVNTITTTAGTHTAITSQKGDVSFNVPTKTSHLTNDSGFITSDSDEKVKVAEYSQQTTYYPILATGVGTATRQIATNGVSFRESGGGATLALGLDEYHWGVLQLGGESQYSVSIYNINITADRALTIPDKSGTIALTSDIPTVPTKTSQLTNDSGFITSADLPSFVSGVKGNSESSYRTGNVNLTPANIGAVPTSRTVNSKALSSNITLTASDVSAVPTSRTVNSKALSSNITLTASDVSALPTDFFIWDTYSKSVTVSGSGAYNFTMGTLTQHSGYTLRGYINQNGGYTDQWLVSYGTYGSNVVAMVYSKYGGSLTSTISCTAIWTKNL